MARSPALGCSQALPAVSRTPRALSMAGAHPLHSAPGPGPHPQRPSSRKWGVRSAAAFASAAPVLGGLTTLSAGAYLLQHRLRSSQRTSAVVTTGEHIAVDSGVTRQSSTNVHTEAGPSSSSRDAAGQPLSLLVGHHVIPHPDKAATGGEDAFFVTDNGRCLGVADGVGSWVEVKVDAGAYARQLMKHAQEAAGHVQPNELGPQVVMELAFQKTTCQGSCTACILMLEGAKLHAANLGDSGFMVIRKNRIVFKSPQQQHQFNFPYQLGGEGTLSDTPAHAELYTVDLKHGDVVIMGTDGLFDNVFPEEAVAVVTALKRRGKSASVAASGLAEFAQHRAHDQQHMSPFAFSAKSRGHAYDGGKPDDICVLIAYASDGSSSEDTSE